MDSPSGAQKAWFPVVPAELRQGAWPFFESLLGKAIFGDFFGCWVDFREFLEAKMEAKINSWEAFFRCLRARFAIDFELYFGGSKPEK